MITIQIQETDYFLPEDGKAAESQFLELLNNPGETWICAFGFTLQPMFEEIKKADAAGIKIHILLDHSQSTGRAEAPLVKDLAASLKNGDVTITTAGPNSGAPSQIWHYKGLVVEQPSGEPDCWEGSTNFSASAWNQGNSARLFKNQDWATVFVNQFNVHRAWAQLNEPQYQLPK